MTGVVRGVLMTRPGADGAHGGTLQELVRRLPGDLFRTCLARVSPLPASPLAMYQVVHSALSPPHAMAFCPRAGSRASTMSVAMQDVLFAQRVANCHHLHVTPHQEVLLYLARQELFGARVWGCGCLATAPQSRSAYYGTALCSHAILFYIRSVNTWSGICWHQCSL